MSETDNSMQGQKPKKKYSRLAIVSGVCLIGYVACIFISVAFGSSGKVGFAKFFSGMGYVCLLAAPVFGIVGIISILRSKGRLTGVGLCLLSILVPAFLSFIYFGHRASLNKALIIKCEVNLRGLYQAIQTYANDNDGQYPRTDKWCDLLVQSADLEKKWFVKFFLCRSAVRGGDEGRCHYAINPNCEPNSAGDIVLLFETKGGWNQFGGPELLTADNHMGKGCNVLFNDGHVEFVHPERPGELKWGEDEMSNVEQGKSIKK